MGRNIKGSGRQGRCMAKDCAHGKTGNATLGSTSKTRNTGLGYFPRQMEGGMKAFG